MPRKVVQNLGQSSLVPERLVVFTKPSISQTVIAQVAKLAWL